MKNKQADTELTSFRLTTRYLAAPYDFIDAFACAYHNYSALADIKTFMLATTNRKKRKRMRSASDVLFFCEELEKLMEACWLVLQTDPEAETGWIPIDICGESFYLSEFLFARKDEKRPWSAMPRHLDENQFCRPMLAIRKFFKKRSLSQWKELLNLTLHDVLSTSTGDLFDDNNLYEQHLHMACLIESSYLLYVRRQPYYLEIMQVLQQQQDNKEEADIDNAPSTNVESASSPGGEPDENTAGGA